MTYDSFINLLKSLYGLLGSPGDVHQYALAVQSVFIDVGVLISMVFVAILGYVAIQKRSVVAPPSREIEPPQPVGGSTAVGLWHAKWETVKKHLDSTHESDWKVALLEADKLTDDALAQAGFAGSTFGDRLTNIAPGQLVSLDGIWWAHKVRNRLAHESDYFLRYTEARQALGYFEAALAELQLL